MSAGSFVALNWRAYRSGSMVAWIDILLPSGVRIHDLSYHERDGSRWLAFPGRLQLSRDGQVLKGKDGKPKYSITVSIEDPEVRRRFQAAGLAAIDALRRREP